MKIGITNLKGGVGKTTLSINLAVCFAHMQYKVCVVDTDTNQNSLAWYGARDENLPEVTIVGVTDPKGLQKAVNSLHNDYDIVIMDGTPNLGEMNTRVIIASDLLLIPTRPGAHDFRAMSEFMNRVQLVKEQKENIVAYFIINEFDDRFKLHQAVKDSLKEYDVPLLKSMIKSRTAYGESNLNGTGVYEHPDIKAKTEITALTAEVIRIASKHHFLS